MNGHNIAVSLRFGRPEPETLRGIADAGRSQLLTYEPIGMSALPVASAGYRRDEWSTTLGHGAEVFKCAALALRTWQVHRGAGLVVLADGPPAVGMVVAMSAPLPIGYVDAVCRVVDVIDEADTSGFTYGTLRVHPERGEESFTVSCEADNTIILSIVAVWSPCHPLAKACPPLARRLQRAASNRYLNAAKLAANP